MSIVAQYLISRSKPIRLFQPCSSFKSPNLTLCASVKTAIYLTHHVAFSPRSGRQHKAWGVSPRVKYQNVIKPAKRVTAVPHNIRPNDSAAARFAGFDRFPDAILGLAPQALCWRPLRGLPERDLEVNCDANATRLNANSDASSILLPL